MKRIFLLLGAAVVLVGGVFFLFNKSQSGGAQVAQTQQAIETQQSQEIQKNTVKKVTAVSISPDGESSMTLVGTVKANDQIKIMSVTSGQMKTLLVQEGSFVKAGDPIATIGGINNSKSPAEIQLQIAEINYESAQKGLQVTKAGNETSLNAAELQLLSAQHQAEGSYLDLQVFDTNLDGIQDGLFYLHDNYNTTIRKSNLDLEKGENAIDQLNNSIQDLENSKSDLIETYEDKIDAEPDAAKRQLLRDELETQIDALDVTLDDLYSQFDEAGNGVESGKEGVTLAGNQFLGQIQQLEAQGKSAYLNQQSMQTKLGLYDNSSDPVRLAEEGLNGVKVKNAAALLQAETQMALAKSNLELARAQADGLLIKAPIDGVVSEILVHPGDVVGPQTLVTSISGLKDYELRVSMDGDTASRITLPATAEVKIGGRFITVPIKSIAPVADSSSKLVSVVVALPNIIFRANQILTVRIPFHPGMNFGGGTSLYVPLDAVIIGTEEQYVFVAENGKAVKKNIELGQISGAQAEVISGVESGDMVIVDGAKELVDGQEISL